ncbi:MAG: D-alanyl-D-alanine carboxypeptidase family protein [Nostoc sp. DedVER02]|uniref:D-alanyl-D-alanine carboxypeptidase family protein n=1 Tax=unclassified Nostoc TaxID=2593658 RepID=UPI002AD37E2A|nr:MULTISPECIES: D-alanyl-D-alanine carboxypeptidase family protein [unclassified Nostoc]MDZ7987587.1 D-alanyl-D-alanine carboxypeptidase family protein [Nostoc sp. DedVER02]MDZ8112965.1 D-alanyl-D-alanine carboxypeptidase family protein [Nostoc sp. DedVER01b]
MKITIKKQRDITRFIRKASFIIIVIGMIFILVASNEITHHKFAITAQPLNVCSTNTSLSCIDTSKEITSKPFIPNPQLNAKERFLSAVSHKLATIPQAGTYEYTLLRTYGAVFVNQDVGIKLPQKNILINEQETQEFQATLTMVHVDGTNDCYLQKSAADALNKARVQQHIPLKSGYGSGDCTRTFNTNLRFWQKYANNQTLAKVQQGKETKILGLVAPPGTSQHLWGLAIDLRVGSKEQRKALNENGWFQTVENDVPHWTYVGLTEDNLPLFGFNKQVVRGIIYWITPL